MKKILIYIIILLAFFGLLDASYLAWEHYAGVLPPCSVHWWVDCGKVLSSSYSTWWGVPLGLVGAFQYLIVLGLSLSLLQTWRQKLSWWLLVQTSGGFIFSLYFVWLQLFVIHAICLYCMASAMISMLLFGVTWYLVKDKLAGLLWLGAWAYQWVKKGLFLIDPEIIHDNMVRLGEILGKIWPIKVISNLICNPPYPSLTQNLAGISFKTPVGLAAGFDYEARLTQILYTLGFSFQSIGTITHQACAGNSKPRLGRLPLSKSLLVNKGFRNPGAKAVIRKLAGLTFHNPVGISIGQTNTNRVYTRASVMDDILGSFRLFEKSSVAHQYYELNISCPNLKTAFDFYNPKNLDYLLSEIDALELTRPVFIKMPISEPDAVILELLKVITKHSPVGVIIGNLHKDRLDPAIVPSERQGLGPGNLSGKATFNRSNHLIALTYRHFHSKLLIIGCGGVFTPEDAYLKIQLGASLIQLITGMIFQGPQLVAQLNYGLAELVAADGYKSVSQAVGKKK